MKLDDFELITIEDICNPQKTGPLWTYKNHWWLTDGKHVFIYNKRGANSPQCNTNRLIVERVLKIQPHLTSVFLPWAYLKFNISDYV